jgi:hypothetical protein
MDNYVDAEHWKAALKKPDWYFYIQDDFKRLEDLASQQDDMLARKAIKNEAYTLVEEALQNNSIPLAVEGPDLDRERKPIDTIVIHHTKNLPGMTLERLNAMQLLRIYGGYYANPSDDREKSLKGQPVWSNHFFNGQQVFWGYHWFVREDGRSEQILENNYVGWHAGNWDINTRSIGICIDDYLEVKEPNEQVLDAIAKIIKAQYSQVLQNNIIGHHDAKPETECPGKLFASSWRQKLIDRLA